MSAAGALRRRLRTTTRRVPVVGSRLRQHDHAAAIRKIQRSGIFDREWYEVQRGRRFPDEPQAIADYLGRGREAGLSPSPLFEPAWFAPKSWRRAAVDPLLSYLARGAGKHGIHPLFDDAAYLRRYPAAARHPGRALGHFLTRPDGDDRLLGRRRRYREVRPALLAAQLTWREQNQNVRRARRHGPVLDEWDASLLHTLPAGHRPLVSVLMPVRDQATQLVAAVASVQAQSWSHWELIVVDDGSSDATAEVATLLAASDPRIRVVSTPPRGVAAARNRALQEATGTYVAFLDSDNIWTPHQLAAAVVALADGRAIATHATAARRIGIDRHDLTFPTDITVLQEVPRVDLNALVVTRTAVGQVGGFAEDLARYEDWDFVLRLTKLGQIIPLPLVGSWAHQDLSITTRASDVEPPEWAEVVLGRHQRPWDQVRDELPGRFHEVSVLVPAIGRWTDTVTTVRTALASAANLDVEVVVVQGGGTRFSWTMIVANLFHEKRIRFRRTGQPRSIAYLANVAFLASRGRTVVILPGGATVVAGSVVELARAATREGAVAAQPLVVDSRGGLWPPGRLGSQDDSGWGAPPLLSLVGSAVVATALAAVDGLDPRCSPGGEMSDLVLRLAAGPEAVVVVESSVRVEVNDALESLGRPDPELTDRLAERWDAGVRLRFDDAGRKLGLALGRR
ncbi:MAG: glycosyltransferase [Actinomycetota bacterium]|nr:MAG: glycosyltransferase [Actinomycetota bacterium]